MYGVVTRNEPELEWAEFDRGFYEVKDVTGRAAEPVDNAVNMVSCFADNKAAADNPDLVPESDAGEPATRDRPYFDWAYVCPTHERYRDGLLEIIEEAGEVNPDVRLDDVGFPRDEYCHCDRCEAAFADSDFDDWEAWRADVITDFVADARERVPGDLLVTLYPDPYPGHIYDRAGTDVEALAEYVDEFVVPIYDMAYTTTYWLEALARGFQDELGAPFSVELYAVDVDIDNLVHATEVADEYAESVLFGYDASNARATVRRMRADARNGEQFGPE
ncbi:alpha-amylase family protein [Halosimplex sp. J119]